MSRVRASISHLTNLSVRFAFIQFPWRMGSANSFIVLVIVCLSVPSVSCISSETTLQHEGLFDAFNSAVAICSTVCNLGNRLKIVSDRESKEEIPTCKTKRSVEYLDLRPNP